MKVGEEQRQEQEQDRKDGHLPAVTSASYRGSGQCQRISRDQQTEG